MKLKEREVGKQKVDMLNYHYSKYAMHCHDSLKEKSV